MTRQRQPRCNQCTKVKLRTGGGFGTIGGYAVKFHKATRDGGYMCCEQCGKIWYTQAKYLWNFKYGK